MKKTIVVSVFMLSGVIITMSIIIAAAVYVPNISSWSGSKLWYAIFGAKQYGSQAVQSLFLGFPFTIGLALSAIGVAILLEQYFKKED